MAKSDTAQLEELNALCDEMVKIGEAPKEHLRPIWRNGYDYIFHNQLADKARKKGWPDIQCNQIYPGVMQALSETAHQRIRLLAQPWEPNDRATAKLFGGVLQWQFEKALKMEIMRILAKLDGAIYGYYIGKFWWEPRGEWDAESNSWKGRVEKSLIRPDIFGYDPETEDYANAAFCYTHRRVRVAWAVAKWPQFKAEIIKAAQSDDEQGVGAYLHARMQTLEDETDAGTSKQGLFGTVAQYLHALVNFRLRPGEKKEKLKAEQPAYVTLNEIFFHDGQTIEKSRSWAQRREEMLKSGDFTERGSLTVNKQGEIVSAANWPKETEKYSIPTFPNGRRIFRVAKTILNPRDAQQQWTDPTWPYRIGINAPLPHTIVGQNAVEPARNLQDFQNGIMAHFENYVGNFSDPRVKVESGALAGDHDMKNVAEHVAARAGSVIKVEPNRIAGVAFEPPPGMPSTLFEIFSLYAGELKDQTGTQNVNLGRATERTETATAIATYMQQSKLRSGLSAMFLDLWTVESMELVGYLCQKHMPIGEVVRIVGDKYEESAVQFDKDMQQLKYDLKLDVGPALPLDREQKKLDAAQLYELIGEAFLPNLLQAYEVPEQEEVLARHQQYQAFLMHQEQMAQEQQAEGEPA